MTTTEQNPARSEYFDQLETLHGRYFAQYDFNDEYAKEIKERILSITYDANVALQKENNDYENAIGKLKVERAALYKRVEELEEALRDCRYAIVMAKPYVERAYESAFPDEQHNLWVTETLNLADEKIEQLLTK